MRTRSCSRPFCHTAPLTPGLLAASKTAQHRDRSVEWNTRTRTSRLPFPFIPCCSPLEAIGIFNALRWQLGSTFLQLVYDDETHHAQGASQSQPLNWCARCGVTQHDTNTGTPASYPDWKNNQLASLLLGAHNVALFSSKIFYEITVDFLSHRIFETYIEH
jgi:hypothetical protein